MLMLVRNGAQRPSNVIAFRSNRLSRWAVAAACCAVVDFVAAQALLIGRLAGAARPAVLAGPFAVLYLVIASGLILITFGALLQWAPASGAPLPDRKLAFATLVLLQAGAVATVAGISVVRTTAAPFAPYLLLAGGALIAVGALLAIVGVAPALLRLRPSPFPGGLMLAGFVSLFLTLIPGLVSMLPSAAVHSGAWLTSLTGSGMAFFAFAGLGGWFVLTLIGASYRLLPAFTAAPDGRSAVSKAVFCLCVAGTALAVIAAAVNLYSPAAALATLMKLGSAVVAIGVILYFAEISHVRIYGVGAGRQSGGAAPQQPSHSPHQSVR
jgi:hypothetical protein